MAPKKGSVTAMILGGLALLSAIGLALFFFKNTFFGKPLIANSTQAPNNADQSNSFSKVVSVEDVSESEDEAEAEEHAEDKGQTETDPKEDEEARLAELRRLYDDTVRMATKLLKGESYHRAAEKFSEAIELATSIPSAGKDILTLYNNRSATYERSKEFEKALGDIMVVLTMDPSHLKARTRRARVYESMGKLKESLNDFVLSMILEQARGEYPSNAAKIEELCKIVSKERAEKLVGLMRTSKGRDLPSRMYCKNLLESFASIHAWRAKFSGVDRATLSAAVDENPTLEARMNLFCYDISMGNPRDALLALEDNAFLNSSVMEHNESNQEHMLTSIYWEFMGTSYYLRGNFGEALQCYERATRYFPTEDVHSVHSYNFDAKIKQATLHLDLGELDEAHGIFDDVINQLSTPHEGDSEEDRQILLAWALIHRSSFWVAKNETGKIAANGTDKAIVDVELAIELSKTYKEQNSVANLAYFNGLVKLVHTLSFTKPMSGNPVNEDDMRRSKECMDEARSMFPENENILLLDPQLLLGDGDILGALASVDKGITLNSDAPDFLIIKASIMIQRANMEFQLSGGSMDSRNSIQSSFLEAENLYKKALEIDSQALDALFQYAQFKTMIGDPVGAVELLDAALPLCRNRDEAYEFSQMYEGSLAQAAAFTTLKSYQ